MMGFPQGLRRFWTVPMLGAALAVGWFFGVRPTADVDDDDEVECSLTEGLATAPARLEEGPGFDPDTLVEAETAELSVQSALDVETKPIRADGPEPRVVEGAADGPTDHLLDLVTSESRLVIVQLVQENKRLQSDLDEGLVRNRKLNEALASAQAALDMNEVRRVQEMGPEAEMPMDLPIEARIADVNADLGLVILNCGARQGVRYGMVLTVLRDRKRLGKVRVVDVRENIAGATIEEMARGGTPQNGDRAVLMKPSGP